ncbi:hypothetical protein [uncultured Aquimarina sp.]|uniref:hypothetical protein n=1 Tax=uncultured Aquimarina sp. TaxID=575652 RepID=UPI00260D4988|nr:hypothetical protein [uncultured Aquimarina sp.]
MNDKTQNSIHFFRQFVFIFVVCTMVIQPVTQTFDFLFQEDYELVNYDWDKNAEKEKQEKDSKDEKIEILLTSDYSYQFTNNKKSLCPWSQTSLWDVHLEIPIPPPEQV